MSPIPDGTVGIWSPRLKLSCSNTNGAMGAILSNRTLSSFISSLKMDDAGPNEFNADTIALIMNALRKTLKTTPKTLSAHPSAMAFTSVLTDLPSR